MLDQYHFRRAESAEDSAKLHRLFNEVFHPEDVGVLAETIFNHLPGMEMRYWFIAEARRSGQVVAGFALIPWVLEMAGIRLKVAEMGIVGTLEAHRRRGLMRVLNAEFDRTLDEEAFDLAIIQGIPGFYDQFGYSYALPLENHINLALHQIPESRDRGRFKLRLAEAADIPDLMQADQSYRANYLLSAFRDEAHWRYLLNESLRTEYGSEFWIMERVDGAGTYYCRIPAQGFGEGLIVSEISEDMPFEALSSLLQFCRKKAVERDRAYIRLNLHNESSLGKLAVALGARPGRPYAWQVKITDPLRFMQKVSGLLESRLRASPFRGYSGRYRLNFFRSKIDLIWKDGRLESVLPGDGDGGSSFSINADLFPALVLGHRSWQELRHNRADIFPHSAQSERITETLFPAAPSWIYEQY